MNTESHHACRRCGACCRIRGFVRVSGDEISAIAAFLSMGEREFIHRFTRLSRNRAGLDLAEHENGACVFLQGVQCLIQQVKPQQCRTFPDGWRYPGVEEICPAYRPGITNHKSR